MPEPAWSAPAPIDIPWRDMPGGGLIWQVAEGDAWAFSYLVLQMPGTGKWRSNAPNGQDHDRRDQAVREVETHFESCLRGCLVARPLEEFLDRIAETVDKAARDAIAELRPEAIGLASFAVRPLPWTMTRSGNIVTHGGRGFPWPFSYVVARTEGGWTLSGDTTIVPRVEAQAGAQATFEARVTQLLTGPLEHQMEMALREAAQAGPETLRVAVSQAYGIGRLQTDPALVP